MKKGKPVILWISAFLLTAGLAVFQRMTGPTYPQAGRETINGTTVSYKLLRSHTAGEFLPVEIRFTGAGLSGAVMHRRFKVDREWVVITLERDGDRLKALIPGQPAAAKIEYKVQVWIPGQKPEELNQGRSIVARFKNHVPSWLLVIHIIFMFGGMLLAFRAGMEALRRQRRYAGLVTATLLATAIGGLILGPIVQKIAFGAFWTGFPLGSDMTDTKTLATVIVWLAAFFMRRKSRWWPVAALVLMIAVYMIPHSLLGSELDYRTGKMISG